MGPLVCVAPDGTIEVWDLISTRAETFKDIFTPQWQIDREFIGSNLYGIGLQRYWAPKVEVSAGPEFWGRKVLGEL